MYFYDRLKHVLFHFTLYVIRNLDVFYMSNFFEALNTQHKAQVWATCQILNLNKLTEVSFATICE